MKKILWCILALIFSAIGFLELHQNNVKESDLVEESGVINSIECNSGSNDGSPVVELMNDGVSTTYKMLEKFSTKTKCNEQWKNLVGSKAKIKILPGEYQYPLAHDIIIDNSIIYTIEDVKASNKESGYTILAISFIMIIMLFFWKSKD